MEVKEQSLLDNISNYEYLNRAIKDIMEKDSNINLQQVLIHNFGMSEEDIIIGDLTIAEEIARTSYQPEEPKRKLKKEEDGFLYRNTQFIIDLVLVFCFVAIMVALLFFDIPNNNREILLVLIGALVKSVSQATNYYRGTSFSSYIKTKSMIKDRR